jgi:hypothetical protein
MAETVNGTTSPAELADEAKALSDIVTWSEACCAWQRDALRRLCLGTLNDSDIGQLLAICKGQSVKTSPLAAEPVRDATLKVSDLPTEFRSLRPHEIEDVLCIFKDKFKASSEISATADLANRSWCG